MSLDFTSWIFLRIIDLQMTFQRSSLQVRRLSTSGKLKLISSCKQHLTSLMSASVQLSSRIPKPSLLQSSRRLRTQGFAPWCQQDGEASVLALFQTTFSYSETFRMTGFLTKFLRSFIMGELERQQSASGWANQPPSYLSSGTSLSGVCVSTVSSV
jgi:hypothetical protein